MGRLILLVLTLAANTTASGQGDWRYPVQVDGGFRLIDSSGQFTSDGVLDEVRAFEGPLGAARMADRWGYVGPDGAWKIQPEFLEADDFRGGRARVRTPDGWLIIDPDGRPVTRGPYNDLTAIGDGLAAYQGPRIETRRGQPGLWGILSAESGTERSEAMLDGASMPGEGLIPAQKYRRLLHFFRLERRWGFVDPEGRWVIPPVYTSVRQFNEGRALVSDGRRAYYLAPAGDTLLTVAYPIAHSFSEGLARVGGPQGIGFIDAAGEVAIPLTYLAAGDFSAGLAPARTVDGWGYIDAGGREVIPFRFRVAGPFQGSLARVVDGQTEAYVDTTGRIVYHADR